MTWHLPREDDEALVAAQNSGFLVTFRRFGEAGLRERLAELSVSRSNST